VAAARVKHKENLGGKISKRFQKPGVCSFQELKRNLDLE
jgi:hypothetical protein